jgi:hypothetical protein
MKVETIGELYIQQYCWRKKLISLTDIV